ncbi:hypothetical protein Ancab_005220 [Ancistrocladus abbreviatus]
MILLHSQERLLIAQSPCFYVFNNRTCIYNEIENGPICNPKYSIFVYYVSWEMKLFVCHGGSVMEACLYIVHINRGPMTVTIMPSMRSREAFKLILPPPPPKTKEFM